MERKIKRGDIYYANLNPIIGSEQGGMRPVLIKETNTVQRSLSRYYKPCTHKSQNSNTHIGKRL